MKKADPCFHLIESLRKDGNGWRVSHTHCPHPAEEEGWCAGHAHARMIMAIGKQCQYPRLQVNEALIIGAGQNRWLAYAMVARAERVIEVKRAVKHFIGEEQE
jgi:hypothetical protein